MNSPLKKGSQDASGEKSALKSDSSEQNPFVGLNPYGFFMSMEKEDKEDFVTEIRSKLAISMSTFYNRLREQHPWTEAEKCAIKGIVVKYRKKYGV